MSHAVGRRPLDLRLLLPALVAWAVLVTLLPWGTRALWTAAGLTVGGAVLTEVLRRRGWRRGGVRGAGAPPGVVLPLTLATIALVTLAAAAHLATDRAGPVEQLARERAVVRIQGTALTEPRLISRGDERPDTVVLTLRIDRVEGRGLSSGTSSPVVVFGDQTWLDVAWHQSVRAYGRLGPADPGQQVIAAFLPLDPPERIGSRGAVLAGSDVARERLRQAVGPLPEDARGLIPGLVIGDTSLTAAALTEAMRATGMTHLSAVSGSNVAIVLGAVVLLCGWTGVPRRWRPPLAVLALAGFVVLCRPEPSVLRAGAMGLVGLLGLSTHRRRASLPALATAVIVLLCIDPWLARSHGFALSTLATLGLVVFARPWGNAIAARLPARCAVLGDAIAIPLAAQVVCGPVIVLLQGTVSTVAVLANLLAAPLVAPTTVAGIAAALAAVVWVPLGVAVAWVGALPAWLIGRIARWCALLPMGQVEWLDGPAGAWLLTGVTVVVLATGPWLRAHAKRHPWAWAAALVFVLALLWPVPKGPWPPAGWVVAGCAVGQGDAFAVATGPGRVLLVDTGPDSPEAARCLADLGVRQVDAVVLSHFHADHVGGLQRVLADFPVGAAYVTPVRDPPVEADRARNLLAEAGVPVFEVAAGDRLAWGAVTAEVVWPPRGAPATLGANDASVVLDLVAADGGVRVLFTGDIEPASARSVRAAVAGEAFDVLKVPHHGSAAQDPSLLLDSGATVAMIGVGSENTFGHPTDAALDLLGSLGAVVLRTDVHGDYAVLWDGSRLTLQTREGR